MKAFLPFGFSFLLKIIIPGAVGASCLTPLLVCIGIRFGIYTPINKGLWFAIVTLAIGFLVTFLDDTLYKLFEGYIYWPKLIRSYFVKRLNDKITKKYDRYKTSEDTVEKQMLMDLLLRFPQKKDRKEKDEKPEAILPTRLGNILSSYEAYPRSRYSISGVFFWPRFWLVLDNDTRKEINTIWAEADCLTYISFTLMCVSIFYFLAGILDLLNIPTLIFGSITEPLIIKKTLIKATNIPYYLLGLGVIVMLLSYAFYRISLPLHVKNGTYFQSIFDIHRAKVKEYFKIDESDGVFWDNTWVYLKFNLKSCDSCNAFYPAEMEKCPECKKDLKIYTGE